MWWRPCGLGRKGAMSGGISATEDGVMFSVCGPAGIFRIVNLSLEVNGELWQGLFHRKSLSLRPFRALRTAMYRNSGVASSLGMLRRDFSTLRSRRFNSSISLVVWMARRIHGENA